MKTKIVSLAMIMGLSTITLFAQAEKTSKGVEGVSTADWDKETKMIEVSFNSANTLVLWVLH